MGSLCPCKAKIGVRIPGAPFISSLIKAAMSDLKKLWEEQNLDELQRVLTRRGYGIGKRPGQTRLELYFSKNIIGGGEYAVFRKEDFGTMASSPIRNVREEEVQGPIESQEYVHFIDLKIGQKLMVVQMGYLFQWEREEITVDDSGRLIVAFQAHFDRMMVP